MLPNIVSHETEQKMRRYLALLEKWQAKINLVSPTTIPDAWERHFIDSAQIAEFVSHETKTVFDLGSGAGFPGAVLAMMYPDKDFHMIESDQKKCSFMRTVSRETQTPNIIIHNDRVENVPRETVPDLIMARALASLDKLLFLSKDWIEQNENLYFVFPKGENADAEIKEARKNWSFDCEEKDSKTGHNAKILVLRNVSACL